MDRKYQKFLFLRKTRSESFSKMIMEKLLIELSQKEILQNF
ncbi:hypothetical protein wTpre_500 [Wolbachia endosymbiont of Trichogramma pretiosum]|nr:hypothetical protein wTpre_500 [Wolbachia endosymbiont of Trichogramma pretiosum]